MAKLVDARDLKSRELARVGSSPTGATTSHRLKTTSVSRLNQSLPGTAPRIRAIHKAMRGTELGTNGYWVAINAEQVHMVLS